MARKTIADHGAGRDTTTEKRSFERDVAKAPGAKRPEPGHLSPRRQSGKGSKPPHGQEKSRPRDTGRSGA